MLGLSRLRFFFEATSRPALAIRSRKTPVSDLESAHRSATLCHLANISLRLGRSLRWDAKNETIPGDPEAARWLVRPYRAPWDAELKHLGVG